MKLLFIVICSFVFGVKGDLIGYDAFGTEIKCKKCPHESGNVVLMPTYSLYIIGFLLILLLAIIICLAILLYRSRLKTYNFFPPKQLGTVPTNPDLTRSFVTQTSHELSLLKMDSIQDIPPLSQSLQERQTEGIPSSLTKSLSIKDIKRNTVDRHTGLGKDFKVYRSVKRHTDQQLILREQMKKICEDALARSYINGTTASLKDLSELLKEEMEQNPESSGIVQEKASSYSDLDVYDNVPSNIPIGGSVEEVYDCLPSNPSKNIIVEDYDTKYLLTISRDNFTEPAYINAQYRYNKL